MNFVKPIDRLVIKLQTKNKTKIERNERQTGVQFLCKYNEINWKNVIKQCV